MSVTERRHETRTVPPEHERRRADSPQGTMRTNPETRDPEMRDKTRDPEMRDNPEVMGRKEPLPVETRSSEMWPDMTDYQTRFDAIQSDFIEDPKSALHKAEKLIEEAVDSFTRSMREHMKSKHGDTDGHGDTEHLRLQMREYRDFIRSLGGRRAA